MHLRTFNMDQAVTQLGRGHRKDGLEMSGHSTISRWECSGGATVLAVEGVSLVHEN